MKHIWNIGPDATAHILDNMVEKSDPQSLTEIIQQKIKPETRRMLHMLSEPGTLIVPNDKPVEITCGFKGLCNYCLIYHMECHHSSCQYYQGHLLALAIKNSLPDLLPSIETELRRLGGKV